MENQNDVKKIIEYLEGKIINIKEKLQAFDSPMMQDMAKNSPHLQMEYIRLTVSLQENEDNLLAIRKFANPDEKPTQQKNVSNKRQN